MPVSEKEDFSKFQTQPLESFHISTSRACYLLPCPMAFILFSFDVSTFMLIFISIRKIITLVNHPY